LVDLQEAVEAHGRVIDRIRVRDRAGAERAMRAVIGRAKNELRRRRGRIGMAGRDAP
jgi:DNA-binding GntR family transcriptional regulator